MIFRAFLVPMLLPVRERLTSCEGPPLRSLTVDNQAGLRVDLDSDVSSFVPIENGPARGVVYTVADTDREGLWFAPR